MGLKNAKRTFWFDPRFEKWQLFYSLWVKIALEATKYFKLSF